MSILRLDRNIGVGRLDGADFLYPIKLHSGGYQLWRCRIAPRPMRVMRRLVGYLRRTTISARGQIAESHAILVIEYRQPKDLFIGHILGKVTDLIALEAVT